MTKQEKKKLLLPEFEFMRFTNDEIHNEMKSVLTRIESIVKELTESR